MGIMMIYTHIMLKVNDRIRKFQKLGNENPTRKKKVVVKNV